MKERIPELFGQSFPEINMVHVEQNCSTQSQPCMVAIYECQISYICCSEHYFPLASLVLISIKRLA